MIYIVITSSYIIQLYKRRNYKHPKHDINRQIGKKVGGKTPEHELVSIFVKHSIEKIFRVEGSVVRWEGSVVRPVPKIVFRVFHRRKKMVQCMILIIDDCFEECRVTFFT